MSLPATCNILVLDVYWAINKTLNTGKKFIHEKGWDSIISSDSMIHITLKWQMLEQSAMLN
jgi:hypothetical protein